MLWRRARGEARDAFSFLESKQAGLFAGAVKCTECLSACGIRGRSLCSCTASIYLPSSDLLKTETAR